ncbi:MAG: trypsin-like peptidase domain-containing protein [candidate division Zixibacteria bacterium]|nr:trypsin-like peptidase domain-containing protein [candidate division Zixibacteria bacterium]
MAETHFSSENKPIEKPKKGFKSTALIVALAGILVFVLVLSGEFKIPQNSQAQSPTNISETGLFPLVDNNGRMESPFVAVVEAVKNAVVNVSARSKEQQRFHWWQRGSRGSTSSGSGFFFREDGYILTNNHVVSGADKITVRTSTGYTYDAEVVGTDPQTDLAVLKVEPQEEIVIIPFGNSDDIKVGDWAIAIGNPFPQQGLDRTVTVGVISAKGRSNLRFGSETPQYQDYIQTDASINPGNSGGPLLNLRGEAIGVNAAISSPTGSSVGVGFAIPIDLARAIVPDLITNGKASRGWLGVWFAPLTQREAKRQGLDEVKGVIIDSVFINSPADVAGIESGDVIVGFNNHQVENTGQLSVLVSTTKSGQEVPIDIIRDRRKMTLNTVVADRAQFLANVRSRTQTRTQATDDFNILEWNGMEIMEFTPEIARALELETEHDNGIYVRRVYPGSAADRASISRGTIILQVDEVVVRTLNEMEDSIQRLRKSSRAIGLIVQEPDGTIARKVIRR